MYAIRSYYAQADVQALLALLGELSRESQSRQGRPSGVTLDSALEADLGFDSLVRAEMIQRIEQRFGVSLPPQVLTLAESPRDLWSYNFV